MPNSFLKLLLYAILKVFNAVLEQSYLNMEQYKLELVYLQSSSCIFSVDICRMLFTINNPKIFSIVRYGCEYFYSKMYARRTRNFLQSKNARMNKSNFTTEKIV